ncbi:vWA domain-containing protein [Corynebacterium caspium]|uniref:vWA domain-containing protein n=1 Tax=Corynebacterium caspium TaxID=234828 RepID=UPI00039C8BAB|nr:vWA domain-containing protein [Corynebacterium caspium]WKD59329.1 hypothetical protein CCASP_04665 [Corynebacterium caspium DSM 44850]
MFDWDWSMGRHRASENKFAIAGWVVLWTALLAVAVASTWYIATNRNVAEPATNISSGATVSAGTTTLENSTANGAFISTTPCTGPEIILPIAIYPAKSGETLLSEFNEAKLQAGTSCAVATQTELSEAAILIAPDTPATAKLLTEFKRTPTWAASPLPVFSTAVVAWGEDLANLAYPLADQPDAAITAAMQREDDPMSKLKQDIDLTVEAARTAGKTVAVPATLVPAGEKTTVLPDTKIVSAAQVLTPVNPVNTPADLQRATEVFMVFAASRPETQKLAKEAPADTSPMAANSEKLYTLATIPAVADSIYLLDTSARMENPKFGQAKQLILADAQEVKSRGYQLSLWNYSSPINPGVSMPWRANLRLHPEVSVENIAAAIDGFGIAGVPQTRTSVLAALDEARNHPGTTRVVLITSGTEEDMSDADFAQRLGNALNTSDVVLEVIHIGDAPRDQVLQYQATRFSIV